jgi:hypothetical protein
MLKSAVKQNAIFNTGRDFCLNACVGINGGPYVLADYAKGYAMATYRIAESLKESSAYVDLVIYPLVFNCRHSVELYLKHLIDLISYIESTAEKISWTHKLTDNWLRVNQILVKYLNEFDVPIDLLDSITKFVNNLVEIDPKGEAFRYPHARDRVKFLQETSIINVETFVNAFRPVQEGFEFLIDQVATFIETKHRLNNGQC